MARIEGKVRMRKVLKILPITVRKQIQLATLAAAEEINAMQQALAPVRTGKLRKSNQVVTGDKAPALYARVKSRRIEGDPELAAVIFNDDPTARLTEFGTAPHVNKGKFPGTENPGTRAQPFFFPGFRAMKKRAQAKINKAARQGIKEGLR